MLDVLSIGIVLCVLVGVALLFHTVVKVTPEEGWASAIMSILILIYITGLMGNTKIALLIISALAVIGIVFGVVSMMKKSENSLKTFFTPGIVMMFGITAVGVIAFRGMLICNWDELYQWGKAANFMVEFDKLPGGAEFTGESILLSSTTFSHYFMAKLGYILTGEITESHYYVSNLLLWFSALILPFSGMGWKSWKRIWGFGFFHFMLTAMIFVQPYYNIYTDQPTAYWTGGLIAWMLLGKMNKKNIYLVPMILMNVGLMKSMVGPLFAVIAMLSALVLYLTSRYERKENILPKGWKKMLFSKKGIIGLIVILSPIVFVVIWSVLNGANGLFRSNGGIVNPGEEDRLVLTVKSMLGWIFKSVVLYEDRIFLSYGLFILLTIGMVYILYPVILDKKDQLKYKNLMSLYIIGFAGFFFIMLFAYMKVFGYVDSIRAQSLNRYFADYIMLGIVPLTLPLFLKSKAEQDKHTCLLKKGVILVTLLVVVYGSGEYFLRSLAHPFALDKEVYAEREEMSRLSKKVKDITNETGKIYFINQGKSGYFTLAADYEMGDQLLRNGMCFYFRKDTSEPILGLSEYPIETLPPVLAEQGYEYLWVYHTNDYFNKNMKKLFNVNQVKNGKLYKVVRTEDGVSLEYMKRIK